MRPFELFAFDTLSVLEDHITSMGPEQLRKYAEQYLLVKDQLDAAKEILKYYAEGVEYDLDDYEEICHENCKISLEKTNHHNILHESKKGKLARDFLELLK